MKPGNHFRAALLAAAVLIGAAPAAHATQAVPTITGKVSAPPTHDRIYVDGRPYQIQSGSRAAADSGKFRVGDAVSLILVPVPGAKTAPNVVMGILPLAAPQVAR